ncbi:MAG: GNAT family N-acetyltransferase [Flavobacteriales bacterium]
MEELANRKFDKTELSTIFLKNLTHSNIHYFIAELNGKPAGFGSLYIQPLLHHAGPVGEIQELVVMPEFRSTGIGKQLLDHITLLATEKGCCLLELASSRSRTESHRFYLREGFADSHHKFTKKL